MKKWWMGAGLLAAWAATAGVVNAQAYVTTPYGAARYPDPIPVADNNPTLTPGPLTPLQAPPGPSPELSLPPGVSNAYPCGDPIAPDVGIYFHLGALGLKPNRMGDQPIAVFTQDNLKDGTPAAPGLPEILDSHDVETNFMWGMQGTLGYQEENRAVEFTGFYLFERSFGAQLQMPGQLDAQFYNAPFGFSGDNGIFTHDDVINLTQTMRIANGEMNFRYSDRAVTSVELILGLRSMYIDGSYDIAVGQDNLTFPMANGAPDLRRVALYSTETKVLYGGPQIGMELDHLILPDVIGGWLSGGFNAKASVGAAYVSYNNTLTRGDGFLGFDRNEHDTTFMQVYELEAFLEFHLAERVKIRGGYKALWLLNCSTPEDQVNFNLADTQPQERSTGSMFLSGPTLEFAFYF